jgi:hypothetical protein
LSVQRSVFAGKLDVALANHRLGELQLKSRTVSGREQKGTAASSKGDR